MRNWGDGKRFIFEDLVVYSGVILSNFGHDLIFNFLHSLGILSTRVPLHIGWAQSLVGSFFIVLLVRKFMQWRYYE